MVIIQIIQIWGTTAVLLRFWLNRPKNFGQSGKSQVNIRLKMTEHKVGGREIQRQGQNTEAEETVHYTKLSNELFTRGNIEKLSH